MEYDLTDLARYNARIDELKSCGAFTHRNVGFAVPLGDVNRFTQRYRLAKSFQSITFAGYSDVTSNAYAALLRVFLVWSAFEILLRAMKLKQMDTAPLFERHGASSVLEAIRKTDRDGKVASFLLGKVNQTHEDVLSTFLAGGSVNIAYFISGVRHVFAHGILTPHAGGAAPEAMASVCTSLSDFLLKVMDAEFSRCLDEAPKAGPLPIEEVKRRMAAMGIGGQQPPA
ncbi:MAG: hypothetical protein K9M56_00920 [Victivallales bacterium]|nr:hypothetical protein [Victivallales bacterium]